MKILLIDNYKFLNFFIKNEIKKLINIIANFLYINNNIEISILFTNNKEIKNFNLKYRKINKETDVISFPTINYNKNNIYINNFKKINNLGDIVISVEKIYERLKLLNIKFKNELFFLIIHGFLHLNGFLHNNVKNRKIMFFLQKKIIFLYNKKSKI